MCLLALGLIATGFRLHPVGWLETAVGCAIGFGAGIILFQLGGFGGGDVKLFASLGAALGWRSFLGVMFYVAILGGVFALLARWRGDREFAYAPAIALGLLAFIVREYLR